MLELAIRLYCFNLWFTPPVMDSDRVLCVHTLVLKATFTKLNYILFLILVIFEKSILS